MTSYTFPGPTRYAHQVRALKKIIECQGTAALLLDPGTGKTAVALDYASILALKNAPTTEGVRETRVLVVCPLVAVDTWVEQARTYVTPNVDLWAEALGGSVMQKAEALAARGGSPRLARGSKKSVSRALGVRRSVASFLRRSEASRGAPDDLGLGDGRAVPRLILEVVNLDVFSQRRVVGSGTTADVLFDAVKRYSPDLVIVDESHRIKSATSQVSRLLSRIGNVVPRRLILTGTVMPHSPLDVFGQWRFLDPEAFGDRLPGGRRKRSTLAGFKARYAVMGGYLGKEIKRFHHLDEMQAIMAERAVVVRKEDALDLPQTKDIIVPVHLSPAEERAYAAMKSDLAVALSSGDIASTPNRLAQMMRLRQITSGYVPADRTGQPETIGTSKADVIRGIVQDTLAGESRVVIFCNFRHEIEALVGSLAERGTVVEKITGETSPAERKAIRSRFGDTERHPERIVLVAQVKTLSLAVNELVTASHAIFGSLSLQRDDMVQARDRLDRIGQTRPVTYWYALAPGSVDEVIYTAIEQRTNLEEAMLRHILDREEVPVLVP